MSRTSLALIGHGGCFSISLGLALVFGAFVAVEPLALPPGGPRGAERRRFRERSIWARLLDDGVRRAAVLIEPVIPEAWTRNLDARLQRAGDFLGLCASEWVASCILSSVITATLGAFFAFGGRWAFAAPIAGAVLAIVACFGRLDGVTRERERAADRQLPAAIDLIAMCMGAGMDFPSAVRLVAESDPRSVVGKELGGVLRALSLGRTRREALLELGERLRARTVTDFVAAAVQAEQKGTPLSDVLGNQAIVSRLRRSVATEEAAVRAGVLMVIPLMLLMACIVLLLVGPLVAKGAPQ